MTLSIGKVIVKSGPAKAIGGWLWFIGGGVWFIGGGLWSIQLSHDTSFWQERKRKVTKSKKVSPCNGFHCMITDLKVGIPFTKRANKAVT
jgi:hypothetical protein